MKIFFGRKWVLRETRLLLALIKAKFPVPLLTTGNTARDNFKFSYTWNLSHGKKKKGNIAFTAKNSENWFQLSLLPTSGNVNFIVEGTKFVHLWKQVKKSDV
jgi:hypothetical protein